MAIIYTAQQFLKTNLQNEIKSVVSIHNRGKHKLKYLELYCGFDIETTTLDNHNAYMYHWQFSFNDMVVCGRRWHEFISVIDYIKTSLNLSNTVRIIIWIANLGFEFQFIRKLFNITRVFAKEPREPLYAVIDDCIELRECLQITGGNLANLAKQYTKTQKMVGDLDYKKIRNYATPLTDKELQYCYNDVIILSEFSEYIFNDYIKTEKYVPMTKTGILRKQVKKLCTEKNKIAVEMCYPEYSDYKKWMLYVFRGGFVHANIMHVNKRLQGVTSYDRTSSYPASMNLCYYPITKFIAKPPKDFYKYINDKCCIFVVTFKNIRSRFSHSIESKSKCLNLVDPIIDNGRVQSATVMTVHITEIDFFIYNMYYDWDKMIIHELMVANRGRLPQYLLKPLNHAYMKKDELKKNGLSDTTEYALYKNYVNSAYGMTVTRLVEREIIYDNNINEWVIDDTTFNYNKEVAKAFLLPQWGIYVTAHSRYALLSLVYKIEKRSYRMGNKKGDVLYCDTDSIKMLNYKYYTDIIDNYNNNIIKQLHNIFSDNFSHYDTLGTFECEYINYTSKFLGAKRYITTDDKGNTKVTVAGLPKKSLVNYCKHNNLDIYEVFSDGMILNTDVSMKNASCYNDEPHTDIVDGVRMFEKSSVGIFEIPFTMKLNDLYLIQINNLQSEGFKYEDRIY